MNCSICRRELNVPGNPLSGDCGGDCVACMADAGDPWHQQQVEDHRTTYHGMSEKQVAELKQWWQEYYTKMIPPGVWQTPDTPDWLDILANSARRA